MAESGVDSAEYLSYMARESENVNLGGNFSIQVLRRALETMGIEVYSITSPEVAGMVNFGQLFWF